MLLLMEERNWPMGDSGESANGGPEPRAFGDAEPGAPGLCPGDPCSACPRRHLW